MSEKKYVCDDNDDGCDWIGTHSEMIWEFGFGYDQRCCPMCNVVLFNDISGNKYCKSLNEIRKMKLEKIKLC